MGLDKLLLLLLLRLLLRIRLPRPMTHTHVDITNTIPAASRTDTVAMTDVVMRGAMVTSRDKDILVGQVGSITTVGGVAMGGTVGVMDTDVNLCIGDEKKSRLM